MSSAGNANGYFRVLEFKSYAEETRYNIILSAQFRVLQEVARKIPLGIDVAAFMDDAKKGYMRKQFYGDNGSNVHMFANDYARVLHVMKRSHSDEIDVLSRDQVADILINDGWEQIGFSCHQAPIPSGTALVERWRKWYEGEQGQDTGEKL